MTVRLLAQYQGNPPNTIVTLAGGVETALVAAGNATTDLSGGVPPVYLTPANSQVGDVLYGPDGAPLGIADQTGKLLLNFNGITVPGTPTGVALTPIAGGVLAAFTPSATLGGTVGTGFEVTLSNGRVQRGAASPIVVNSPAGAVTATVKQLNGAGLSAASAASASATVTAYTAPSAPGAPTGLTLVAGNGKVTASWTAAASNGSAIRNTIVTLSNGASATALGSATAVDVATPNGIAVTATARANNGEGAGPVSAVSNSVTPVSGTGTAPAVLTAAAITGAPTQGTPLTITAAAFSGSPTPTVSRVVRMDGTQVAAGNASTTYTPVLGDVGKIPSVTDTATNSAGTAFSTAAGTPVVVGITTIAADGSVVPGTSTANGFMTQVTTKDTNRLQAIIRNQTPFTLVTAEQPSDNLTVTQPSVGSYIDLPPNSQNRIDGNASKMWVGVKAITPSSVTSAGTLCTIVFAQPHAMSTGGILTLIDFVPTGYNAQLYSVTVIDANTLTVNLVASAGAVTTMGKAFPRPITGVTVQTTTTP